ncbi:MAG: DUF72 domain-containing protein [Deltaproteobacteria bacterium]|nr:DUF72 domain-containing protein [Deltaproteobacteria bacterium]
MAILVGTTSWTEKTLIESGAFYPADATTPEARLRHYATRFPIVEVDSSYYAVPRIETAEAWAERTPPGFVFDVKAFRLLTRHQTPPAVLPPELRERCPEKKTLYPEDLPPEVDADLWALFRAALEPLRRAGKLGAVLFQFPPWFVFRRANLDYLGRCAERLEGYRLAVEFRHASWFHGRNRDSALAALRDLRLVHVVVDGPQGFPSSVPAVWEATVPDLSVFRLHGRNAETWQKKGLTAAERFEYLYSEGELREIVPPLENLAERVEKVHVLFNNCYRDYAQRNAASLRGLLKT